MVNKIKIGKKLSALIITGLVFLIISCLHLIGVFHYLEYQSYDLRVRFWADSSFSRPSDEIAVILLDQDSIDWAQRERGWGWPWPRQSYAEIVDYMNLSGANSIAFDVIFSEPSIYRNARQDEIIDSAIRILNEAESGAVRQPSIESPRTGARSEGSRSGTGRSVFMTAADELRSLSTREDDESFASASRNYGHVVQTVMFSTQSGSELSWPSGLNSPVFRTENFGSMLEQFSIGSDEKAQFPIRELRESAGALGCITGIPDSDGIIRRLRPFTLFNGSAIPGLSAASLLVSGKGNALNYNSKTGSIEWEGVTIPVDKDGNAVLRYHGLLDRYIPYRAMDIILSAEAVINGDEAYINSPNFLRPENFTNTYVFFGFYAQGLFDIFATPVSSVYPGMGCHITMLDNMLNNDFIRESSEWLNILLLLVIVVLTVYLAMFINRISLSVGGAVFVILIIVTGAFACYQFGGLWVPMITYLAGTLAAFITVTLYNYATEGSQKRFIKSAFSQYLSPKVIEQIIQDPSQLKLGGEKREMTAIFTDIRSFSTISEALGDPAKLVELLNFYLTRMSNIVLDNQGTIDKYEGDAIIAFFGAPVHMKNHAALACRAAVMMKKAEVDINREAVELGLITQKVREALAAKGATADVNDPCPMFTRLGVNTGDMVVGNMGTPNKMDYTIMGNAVNLAARLEGVNKQYDTFGILTSEYTKDIIGSEFITRPLSRVRVVGLNTPIRLHEILDIASSAPPNLIEMVKNWEKAFNLYEQKDFKAAQEIFKAVYDVNNGDKTAKKYYNRCVSFIKTPPDAETWDDGVDNLTEK